jgi:hypothetical protein
MIGILPDKAREVFGIPAGYEAWAGIAIGYEGDPATLPDNFKQRDLTPRAAQTPQGVRVHRQMGESGTLPGETLGLQDMEDSFQVTCPYCGETVELFLESDVEGSLVQDCEVCCNPWQVQVWTEGGHRRVSVGRGWVGIAKVTSGPASARRSDS